MRRVGAAVVLEHVVRVPVVGGDHAQAAGLVYCLNHPLKATRPSAPTARGARQPGARQPQRCLPSQPDQVPQRLLHLLREHGLLSTVVSVTGVLPFTAVCSFGLVGSPITLPPGADGPEDCRHLRKRHEPEGGLTWKSSGRAEVRRGRSCAARRSRTVERSSQDGVRAAREQGEEVRHILGEQLAGVAG